MAHLKNEEAEVQLSRLKKLKGKELDSPKNLLSGYYREEPYEWIAFDNRTGNLWVARWQSHLACIDWLDVNPEST